MRVPYAHTPKITTRPKAFRLNPNHPLARGLVFLGVANAVGGYIFFDSSPGGYHGTIAMEFPIWNLIEANGRLWWPINKNTDNLIQMTDNGQWWFSGGAPEGNFAYGTMMSSGDTSSWQAPFMKGNYNSAGFGFLMHNGPDRIRSYILGGLHADYTIPGGSIGTYHSAITNVSKRNGNPGGEFYFDGEYVRDLGFVSTNETNFGDLMIGQQYNNQYPFSGYVSDSFVYNRALEESEITFLSNMGDPMLGGLLEPISRTRFIFKTSEAPPVSEAAAQPLNAVNSAHVYGTPGVSQALHPIEGGVMA